MENIIALGIGNQLMMDDGIGIYLVQELEKLDQSSGIRYIIGESDIDYCIEQIESAAFVIIIDAVCSGKQAGELSLYRLADLHEHHSLDISIHNLHLFQMLYQQRETIKGYLIGVEPHEISFHMGLSQTLEEQWKSILEEAEKMITDLIGKK
ncbi:hydrogenase maturation protease [Bacillus ectoiniformans]|uniref:hydrogenase maturation protease n=1 Tax=Bacillus ectoiniformans TaxID=1494429 RepID=UPI00195D84A2|nr:hydrogenase maturation protease [Bacillus ectoiniformans]MBM7647453.1 hydrogenase maturation protease [Bacillus ectoiniformans]